MKLLFDFFPIILFFVAFKIKGIFFATGVAVAAGVAQALFQFIKKKKVDPMLLTSTLLLMVFGGLTLFLRNEMFIKWKPTLLYWLFAVSFAVARVFFNKNLIKLALEKHASAPEYIWDRLNVSWMAFFALIGALNIYIAYHFPTNIWVNFKLFGLMGLMIGFIILQSVFLAKYIKPETKTDSKS